MAIASAYVVHFVWNIEQALGRYSLVHITQRATAKVYGKELAPLV
jgi:hypothetical protein